MKQTTKPSDNKMLALMGKTVVLCLIPKAIDTVYEVLFTTTKDKEETTYTHDEMLKLLHSQKDTLTELHKETVKGAPSILDTPTKPPKKKVALGNGIRKSEAADANRVGKDTFSKPKVAKKPRKKNDMTPLTTDHYDFIFETEKDRVAYNLGKGTKNNRDITWLTNYLNKKFYLNKSPAVYNAIIRGHVLKRKLKKATYGIFNPPIVK